jgi:Ca2+-binding RTX toxin-like protein
MANRDGGPGDDRIAGTGSGDTLRGFGGDDRLLGGDGNDFLVGGRGNDRLDGGPGGDRARYLDNPRGIVADLASGVARDGWGDTDTLIGIERVIGSSFADRIRGSARDDSFSGEAGNDRIDGRGGHDVVWYGRAPGGVEVDLRDGTARGGEGRDRLRSIEEVGGSNFDDDLRGSAADNLFVPDQEGDDGTPNFEVGGDDIVRGRAGRDAVSYGNAVAGVSVRLAEGEAVDGLGNTDRLISIEVVLGSAFADTLAGGDGSDEVRGGDGGDLIIGGGGSDGLFGGLDGDMIEAGAGADTLIGGYGLDRLDGGAGGDRLSGGGGADVFVFGAGSDRIVDFADDVDSILLSAQLADGRTAGEILADSAVARIEDGDAVLRFGSDVLRIDGVASLAALEDDLLVL